MYLVSPLPNIYTFYPTFIPCISLCLAVPLAESQCQDQRSGRHGAATEDQRGRDHGQSQEEVHGRRYICILWRIRLEFRHFRHKFRHLDIIHPLSPHNSLDI